MLSEQDKARCRSHLGYLQVRASSTYVLGVPAMVQTQFMVEGAFNVILPGAEHEVLKLLARMDSIECQIEDDTENVAIDAIDEISLRKDEFEQLVKRYFYWQSKLANLLGIVPNPFDQRWSSYSGRSAGVNVSVSH